VIVVPREQTIFVAEMAHVIMEKDKAARSALLERLGIEKSFPREIIPPNLAFGNNGYL